jgi:hypothetical protein
MSGMIESAKNIYGDLKSGQCFKNFNEQPLGKKFTTILKVAGIALAAGIIGAALGSIGGSFLGLLAGVGFAGVVGTAAFAFFTSENSLDKQFSVCAQKCLSTIKEAM